MNKPPRILIAHNHYGNFAVGGEAQVMLNEYKLLKEAGFDVRLYERTNAEIYDMPFCKRVQRTLSIGWSRAAMREIGEALDEFKPDILHVHNYRFMLTPSIFKAAKLRGIRTVQTLHNYRLLAPCSNLQNNHHRVCEKCLEDRRYSRFLAGRCTSASRINQFMRYVSFKSSIKDNWRSDIVDTYIALTSFARDKLIAAGLPAGKIIVKNNFTADPLKGGSLFPDGHGAVFIGRISEEKGVDRLLEAWGDWDYPLTIIGGGSIKDELMKVNPNPAIRWLGQLDNADGMNELKKAKFLAFPSTWYEGFPMVVVEAKAFGIPVVAEDIGPRSELVPHGVSGLLYPPGNIEAMREELHKMAEMPDEEYTKMRQNARQSYIEELTPEANLPLLLKAYGIN